MVPNIKKCFVLMPFAEKLEEVYREIYKPVCETNGIECWRVDEIYRPGSITKDIIEGILSADIIIADLTSKNANVFYELGFAHTAVKPIIMTAQSEADVPFDIHNYRVIFYEQSITGSKLLKDNLAAAIKDLSDVPRHTNNPIYDAMHEKDLIIQDIKHPILHKSKIMQLIELHQASVAHRAFSIIDDTLRRIELNKKRLEENKDLFDVDELTDNMYDEIVESKELCAGFNGRVIGDISEYLKQQFTREQLRKILQDVRDILLSGAYNRDEKRDKARVYIKIVERKFVRRIKNEIDRLEP